MTDAPNPFTKALPAQLRAWDSTSLRSYLECPRKYLLSIVQGWRQPGGLHVEFGRIYHASVEEYDKARARGMSNEDALDVALAFALENSGQYELSPGNPREHVNTAGPEYSYGGQKFVPWDCAYLPVWRCTDEGPLLKSGKNKGQPNPVKRCVNAKKWNMGAGPGDTCGLCGKPTERSRQWFYGDEKKNRYTLLRALVWYVDRYGDSPVSAYVFPNGKAAVELTFQIPLPIQTPDGEPYLLTGHFDGLAADDGEGEDQSRFVRERKTTGKSLNKSYFDQFEPDIQIDNYDLAGSILFPELKMRDVMLEATQTLVSKADFHRHMIHNTEGKRAEHLETVLEWIKRAEMDAALYAAGNPAAYPMNKAACSAKGGCPFRDICSKDPAVRQRFLEANFVQQFWNPMEER